MDQRDQSFCWQTPRRLSTGVAVMVMFAGANPAERARIARRVPFPPPGTVPHNDDIADASPNTFYSAMSNIDFEIGQAIRRPSPFAFTLPSTPI